MFDSFGGVFHFPSNWQSGGDDDGQQDATLELRLLRPLVVLVLILRTSRRPAKKKKKSWPTSLDLQVNRSQQVCAYSPQHRQRSPCGSGSAKERKRANDSFQCNGLTLNELNGHPMARTVCFVHGQSGAKNCRDDSCSSSLHLVACLGQRNGKNNTGTQLRRRDGGDDHHEEAKHCSSRSSPWASSSRRSFSFSSVVAAFFFAGQTARTSQKGRPRLE